MSKLKGRDFFWILIGIGIIAYAIIKITLNSFTDYLMGDNAKVTKAVIVDEKNYMGNQPVKPEFSYSYKFRIAGKDYKGNAHDKSLQIGDSVEIEYNISYPSINKPLHPKE